MAQERAESDSNEPSLGPVSDTLSSHIAVLDTDGNILSTNRSWQTFADDNDLEMRPDTRGMNYLAIAEEADTSSAHRAADGIRSVLRDERSEFELEYPCHSPDERRWFLLRAVPFTHHGDRYATVTHVDITERKEREQKYRRLTERISDAYYALESDWTVAYWNETVAERSDIPATEIVGERFWDVLPELKDTRYEETLREAMTAQEPRSCEFYYEASDYWVEIQAYPDKDGLSVISQEITDRREREDRLAYRRALLEAQAEATIDGLLLVDSDRTVRFYNDQFLEIWNVPDDLATNRSDGELLEYVYDTLAHPDEFRERIEHLYDNPEETSRDTIELTGDRWLDRYSAPVIGDDGTYYGRLWAFRDITDRKKRERALADQRDELAQIQRLNTLVRHITQALQDATTRDAIEAAVCDRLTESDLYRAVWIGTRSESMAGTPVIVPQTAADVDESYLDVITGIESGPAQTAFRTGEVQIINEIATTDQLPAQRRDAALAQDHHSLAAVPLTTGETTYGVLVVYSPQAYAIGNREEDVLADLGRTIALAIQRVHSQRALTAGTVVALDLRIPDADIGFAEVSSDLECELSLERRIQTDDGRTIYYITVNGADPQQVCALLEDGPIVASGTVVRDAGQSDPALVEAYIEEETRLPLDILTDYGASVIAADAVAGDITVSVELPPEISVRTVLTDLQDVVPQIKVASKQHIDRATKTAGALRDQVRDQLSPKQAATLEAAHARGYYSWPRETTAEDLAATFGVSAPTLHYRLRKAHQIVITALLDGERA
jgi:PAS domain S-box-containing protein